MPSRCHIYFSLGPSASGGGWGGGRGNLGGNCGTGVRSSVSKPTPFIYMAFEKTNPFIYLIVQNVYLFIYCPMIFWYPFIAVSCTNSAPAIPMQRGKPLLLPSPAAPLPFWSYPLPYFNSRHKTLHFAENFMNIGQNLKSYQCVKVSFMCILGWGIYCRIMGL